LAKKLFIKSYGCQMNAYDSARMADVLAAMDYATVEAPEDADLIILNTCHIREKAAEKLYSDLGRLKRLKGAAGKPGAVIAVAGCVAQAEGAEIQRRAPHVDMVFGPQTYHRLPAMVDRAMQRRAGARRAGGAPDRVLDTEFPVESKFDFLPAPQAGQGPSAFLTIQEGCDRFCAFCVVPYTRGAEYSRPAEAVLAEAQILAAGGAREITLLGQNVNAYHGHPGGLGGLIREVARLEGIERIRYTTSHPRDVDPGLIAAHAEVPQLMPFLHLPVQSGSDRVLARMGRRHGADDYVRTVAALRSARPDLALGSDFIVGHPGETEEDFEATLALVRHVGYAQAYSFKFSPRPGTPAAEMADQVADEIKAERLGRLQRLLNAQQLAFNRASAGTDVPVLFDRRGNRPRQLAGRSPHMQMVHATFDDDGAAARNLGAIVAVRVTAGHANSLAGRVESGALASQAGHDAPVTTLRSPQALEI
jgi:tRNA-2-methylthio-N6-dimethylallyladenosine synthase